MNCSVLIAADEDAVDDEADESELQKESVSESVSRMSPRNIAYSSDDFVVGTAADKVFLYTIAETVERRTSNHECITFALQR